MKNVTLFLYEGKHFLRSPFKVVALLLFILAGVYGLHNGASLYDKQTSEIEKLAKQADEEIQRTLAHYDKGETGSSETPWIDITTAYGAIISTPTYSFKRPSPAIVYSIGQTEQFGFYKKVEFWSNPYDADLSEEIANPERIQSGTLDFSFVILFLLPLLLLVLMYNIKSTEEEEGFLSLIYVQTGAKDWWLLMRTSFYAFMMITVLLGLMIYGAMLTNVFNETEVFSSIFLYLIAYLLMWFLVYLLILKYGKSTVSNTLQMVGVWLLFAFIIPATVLQWVSIKKPTNLLTEFLDFKRDGLDEIYEDTNENIGQKIVKLFPENNRDAFLTDDIKYFSVNALFNEELKNQGQQIEEENNIRNQMVRNTYWFNPITFFQNKINDLSETHYNDYQRYRASVQNTIDNSAGYLVVDTWIALELDKTRYLEYLESFGH
jgi:ABC-2 type transport system permease protein